MKKLCSMLLSASLLTNYVSGQFASSVLDTNAITGTIGSKVDERGIKHTIYPSNYRLFHFEGVDAVSKTQIPFPKSSQQRYNDVFFEGTNLSFVSTAFLDTPNDWRIVYGKKEGSLWNIKDIFHPSSNRCSAISVGTNNTFLVSDNLSKDLYLVNVSGENLTRKRLPRSKEQIQPIIKKDSKNQMYAYWEDVGSDYRKACVGRISNSNTLESVVELGDFSFDGAIEFGSDDSLHIVYKNSEKVPAEEKADVDIVFRKFNDSKLTNIAKTSTPINKPVSISVDKDNVTHVTYAENADKDLNLVYCNSTDFSKKQIVDTEGTADLGDAVISSSEDSIDIMANFHSLMHYSKPINKNRGTFFIVR